MKTLKLAMDETEKRTMLQKIILDIFGIAVKNGMIGTGDYKMLFPNGWESEFKFELKINGVTLPIMDFFEEFEKQKNIQIRLEAEKILKEKFNNTFSSLDILTKDFEKLIQEKTFLCLRELTDIEREIKEQEKLKVIVR